MVLHWASPLSFNFSSHPVFFLVIFGIFIDPVLKIYNLLLYPSKHIQIKIVKLQHQTTIIIFHHFSLSRSFEALRNVCIFNIKRATLHCFRIQGGYHGRINWCMLYKTLYFPFVCLCVTCRSTSLKVCELETSGEHCVSLNNKTKQI